MDCPIQSYEEQLIQDENFKHVEHLQGILEDDETMLQQAILESCKVANQQNTNKPQKVAKQREMFIVKITQAHRDKYNDVSPINK